MIFVLGKDFLFSDDWREDIARLEARLAQLEEDLNQRYHPQRHFNNVGFQNYGAPPRRGLVQLNRNPSNPLMENQFRMMRNYDNSPFDDFLSQQSSNIYGRRMGEPPQNPLRQHPSIPLPNPANLVKKPSSNDKKQRSQLSSSSLSQPIPLPNPPSISQPIATDPKPQDTDELSFMRSSKPNANQQ